VQDTTGLALNMMVMVVVVMMMMARGSNTNLHLFLFLESALLHQGGAFFFLPRLELLTTQIENVGRTGDRAALHLSRGLRAG